MAVNVEITKKNNENNLGLLKKFGQKVKESGVLQHSRKIRYAARNESDYVKKKNRLHSIRKKEVVDEQIKLGKITPGRGGRGRRR